MQKYTTRILSTTKFFVDYFCNLPSSNEKVDYLCGLANSNEKRVLLIKDSFANVLR